MKNPSPVHLTTTAEIQERGWAAEARDHDGHLMSMHVPFESDEQCGSYVRESAASGWTVTVFAAPDEAFVEARESQR